ncbi:DUF881 domain-containing protein [Caminicella sporogenes]|uniref:DUF881 domain-containing protein n=1 Tax=Caminicella sporogenes TaxID=166485 RepID=UPI00253FBE77|nr:DUF881 domain-containing protein [Caminicella sporogenes]WIF94748.1 DUF881 domain-containing protein [Caminicella sporogenes]
MYKNKLNIFLLTLILGITISLQIRSFNKEYEYVPLRVIYDYKKQIDKEKTELKKLKEVINDYTAKINEYEDAKIRDGDITKVLKKELNEVKKISGFTDVEGPGIIIIMNDGSRKLYEGENPNVLIVHNIDVLNIINDLKNAGAEAISINNQRLLFNSEIDCSGYTLKINKQEFAQPFIIKAIGNPKQLEAAVKAPGTYGNLLKEIGLFFEVNTSISIKIPKYSEELTFKYLQIKEGE